MKKAVFLLFLFTFTVVLSQETLEKKDVKVGVVLSGGGAKGFAHIAVLKVLEEAGVRVDYIGGTSMGAIIAGLYASGYSANQLDSIVKSIDFKEILSDELPRSSKPFYEKEIGEKYALILPVKNKKVGIPKALSQGQNVLNLLTRLTAGVNNIDDFSKLPIPFLCIATNLENGNKEVLKKGFLPEALMASGAFPTLLAPVEVDGKLLTDGGIVNNFPATDVKNMGADIVIGVDTQSGLENKNELDSAIKILNQIVGFQIHKTTLEDYKSVDVLIKPKLKKFSVVSFDLVNEIMMKGDSAARANFNKLKEIAALQIQKSPKKKIVDYNKKILVNTIEVTGNKNYTRAYMLGKLNFKANDSITYKNLVSSVDNLEATGNFEFTQYKIDSSQTGSNIKFKVKQHNISNYLKFGIHYDDLYKTGILVNITSKHLLIKNDILYADLVLGDNLRYNLNYFIDNGFYWSVGLSSRYNKFSANLNFSEAAINKINIQYEDFTNRFYVQTVFGRKFAIGVGTEQKLIKAYTETISSLPSTNTSNIITANSNKRFYFENSNYLNAVSYIKIDTYNKSYFQKKGVSLDVDFKWYLASSNYNKNFNSFSQVKGKLGTAFTFFNKLTFQYESEAGITIGNNDNRVLDFNLGGYGNNFVNTFVPFYGYDYAQLSSNSFLRSAFTLRYEIFNKNYISTTANYARVEKNIFNKGSLFQNTKSGYLAGYGIDTFLGPIELNYVWSPDHKDRFLYINVGFWF